MQNSSGLSLLVGAAAGLLGGLFGIGGGIILVPALTLLLRLRQDTIYGTSLAVVVPISISGTIIYSLEGRMQWGLILGIASGSVVGAVIGARLMSRVPAKALRLGFVALMTIVAVRLIIWGDARL